MVSMWEDSILAVMGCADTLPGAVDDQSRIA